MKLLKSLRFLVAVSIMAAVPFATGVYVERASAQEDNRQDQQQNQNQDDETNNDSYSYTAQPGDSYSLIARKAVQTYGLANEIDLSQAQIIFAETMLTQATGSPALNSGQDIEVVISDVKNWVDKARELSDEAEAAWQEYTVGVDFNTNNVGESQS